MERSGLVFDRVAEAYDRARRGYPRELIERACEIISLRPGARVLEIGCGTGKLTRDLVERVVSVDACDPGAELLAVAQRHLDPAKVRFHLGTFEELPFADHSFDAVFSATAFHWVDPFVGWEKVERVLRPGGGFALLTHTIELEPELLSAWRGVLPEAEDWVMRDPAMLFGGADAWRENLSELWAWIVKRDVARPEAATLFTDVRWAAEPIEIEESADEALAHIRTQSHYLQLDSSAQKQLEKRITSYITSVGGVYRPTVFAILATARTASS